MSLKKKFTILTLILFLLTAGASSAKAVKFRLVPRNTNQQPWQSLDLFLDAEGEPINALEGKLVFDKIFLEALSVSDGNSIINLWAEKPQIKDNTIIFSGIIPGAYINNNGLILSATFKAKQTGATEIKISEARALLNDGQATPAKLTLSPLSLKTNATGTAAEPSLADKEAPEDFKPAVSSNPDLFDNKYFLVFASQDKNSGLDYYAVYESFWPKNKNQISPDDWQKADSPYLLKDQKLSSYIYIKAVDRAGNQRLVELKPTHPFFSQTLLTNKLFFAIIIIIIAVVLIGVIRFKFKPKK